MSGFAFKAIGFLIVVGGIFFAGFFIGGGFGSGTAQEEQRNAVVECLEQGPLTSAEELDSCLAAGGQ